MIFEQKIFSDGKNVIQGRYAVAEIEPPTFFAVGVLNYQVPTGLPGQVAQGQAQFQFDIPGAIPEEAFANFQPAFDAARAKAEEDLKQQFAQQQAAHSQKIIVPGAVDMPPAVQRRINGRH
jgi:hypothetical protein